MLFISAYTNQNLIRSRKDEFDTHSDPTVNEIKTKPVFLVDAVGVTGNGTEVGVNINVGICVGA